MKPLVEVALAATLLLPSLAPAQEALTLSAVRYAQHELSAPSVTFHPHVAGSIDAALTCAGLRFAARTPITPGRDVVVPLEGLPLGSHTCTGALALTADDGTSGEMPLSIDVHVLPPLKVTVSREDLRLEAHRMRIQADRPLSRVAVEVFGEGGVLLGSGQDHAGGLDRAMLDWTQTAGEALKLVVTAWDEHELPGRVELSPWSYDIPHEDVVFETNQWTIRPGEVPKLEKAYRDVQDVLGRYGPVVEVNLFVAGYTDTVGAASANEGLSWKRAAAIAAWFEERGFQGQIWYQGFGESVLAVATPDETDEPANRRALYLLAAERPGSTSDFPRVAWKQLR